LACVKYDIATIEKYRHKVLEDIENEIGKGVIVAEHQVFSVEERVEI
jgi:hypothetical protein